MTNLKVKNRQLAKLREFRKGMDIEDYLQTEFKQVLRALQNQFVDLSDETLSQYPQIKAILDAISGNNSAINEGRKDLYVANPTPAAPGVVALSPRVLKHGTVTTNVFFPEEAGKYWVDFGCKILPIAAGTFTGTLISKYSNGTAVLSCPMRIDISTDPREYVHGKCLMDLTPSLGVYFETTGDASLLFTDFYCSLTKT